MLWAAIRATQDQWPKAKCVVYTGDHEANKEAILRRVKVSRALPFKKIVLLLLTSLASNMC